MTVSAKRIWVCVTGTYCYQLQPQEVLNALEDAVSTQDAKEKIEVIGAGCLGKCGSGPNALVMNGRSRVAYTRLGPSDAAEIVAAHAAGDKPVERLQLKKP